jgi:hypothetical protein
MVRARLLLLCIVLSALTGCTALRPGGVALLPATQIHGAYSSQAVIGETGHSKLIGQVLVMRRGGVVTLTAELGQTWNSGEGRLRMISAWAGGRELPFRRVTRRERFCTGGFDCQGYRTGVFLFTAESFARAARDGYPATLIGPDAVVDIVIPAALFVEARERARASGVWQG